VSSRRHQTSLPHRLASALRLQRRDSKPPGRHSLQAARMRDRDAQLGADYPAGRSGNSALFDLPTDEVRSGPMNIGTADSGQVTS
jgi:hypothetical protein